MGFGGVLAALPFAVWLFLAIEELPLAAEESVDPKRDMPKGLIFGMFTLIVSALMIMLLNASIGSPEQGKSARLVLARDLGRAAARRLPRHLSRAVREAAVAVRGDRPDRELPHDHLRVRPADLLAVARRLLPGDPVGDARLAQDTAPGAVHRHRDGSRHHHGGVVCARRRERRRDDRRDAAQHGGVRRDDLVRVPGHVVHSAAAEHAQHRAAVSQPARHSGRERRLSSSPW